MPRLLRRKVDTTIEKRIITGLIVSKRFINEVYTAIDFKYFTNRFTQTIAVWAVEFFETYDKVPFEQIQDIFETKKESLDTEESTLIAELLASISERYSLEKGINVEYLRDQTFKYFKMRELQIVAEEMQALLSHGDSEGAEKALKKFRNIQKISADWVNPFSEEEVKKFFEESEVLFFQLPGEAGKYVGPIDKGWLIGIEGAFKRGKTWMLIEFAVIALLSKIPVVFISLEMSKKQLKERVYKRLTAYVSNIEKNGYVRYPCFDCKLNQSGECSKPERTNNTFLYPYGQEKPEFSSDTDYKPCTWCRTHNKRDYEPATWFMAIKRPEFNNITVSKSMKGFDKQFGAYFRIKAYPRFTANITNNIKPDLDILEQTEGIVPQMIIIDYADILAPETPNATGVQKEDESWMTLAGLAGERSAAVITGTQVTKEGLEVDKLSLKHTARWVGKLGHVDAFYAVNQNKEEKKAGILRINTLAHRHFEFEEDLSCYVLQQFNVGQPILDSQIISDGSMKKGR